MKSVNNRLKAIVILALMTTLTMNLRAQSKMPKYGQDSVRCVTNLSLYRDYYKQWQNSKFKNDDLGNTTYKYWMYCFNECPIASQNLYTHGVKLVEFKIESQKDSLIADKYIDTLMLVYNQRIQYFGNSKKYPTGYIKGRQAVDLFQFRKKASNEYYPLFKESFDLMKDETEPTVLYGYFVSSIQYVKDDHAKIELAYETYMKVNDALQNNINSKSEEEAEPYKKVLNNLEPIMVQIATCENLVKVFEPKFDENPTDTILARNLVRLFELRMCTKENLYFKALEQVHKIAPNAQSAYSMGKMALERELYDQAEGYLNQAIEMTSDSLSSKKADTYLLLADIYNKTGKLAKAREAARNVLKLRPDDAFAYLIIGELYVKSASSCTFKDLPVAYWVAADMFAKAASVATDEKIKDIAQKQLAVIRKNFPVQTDIFMRNLTEGQSFTVECWINETTTVRARKE